MERTAEAGAHAARRTPPSPRPVATLVRNAILWCVLVAVFVYVYSAIADSHPTARPSEAPPGVGVPWRAGLWPLAAAVLFSGAVFAIYARLRRHAPNWWVGATGVATIIMVAGGGIGAFVAARGEPIWAAVLIPCTLGAALLLMVRASLAFAIRFLDLATRLRERPSRDLGQAMIDLIASGRGTAHPSYAATAAATLMEIGFAREAEQIVSELFDGLVAAAGSHGAAGPPPRARAWLDEQRGWLHVYRAGARYKLGDLDGARADLAACPDDAPAGAQRNRQLVEARMLIDEHDLAEAAALLDDTTWSEPAAAEATSDDERERLRLIEQTVRAHLAAGHGDRERARTILADVDRRGGRAWLESVAASASPAAAVAAELVADAAAQPYR